MNGGGLRYGAYAAARRLGLLVFALMLFWTAAANLFIGAAAAAPGVILTVPKNTSPPTAGVGTNTLIRAVFDSDINPSTLTSASFTVKVTASGAAVTAAAITYEKSTHTATFTVSGSLAANTGYTATLTTAIQDLNGAALAANYSWTFTTGPSPYISPHARYTTNTALCATCHKTHTATGPKLLIQSNMTTVCFTCHDGSGSSYNEKAYFAPTSQGGLARASYHQVYNTGNTYPGGGAGALQCDDCHDPHGDPNGTSYYPRLLRASDAGNNTYYAGNSFCLACHGPLARTFSGDTQYYANTAGDHTNANAVHYNPTIDGSVLSPASGTGITCVMCHDKHSGANPRLLDSSQPSLCFTCHNTTANSRAPGENVQNSFSLTSTHDIFGASGSKLQCTSCHGPHTVAGSALGATTSDISDPSNTKNMFLTGAGTMTDFCLKCHTSGTLPTAVTSQTQEVPVSIVFVPSPLVLTTDYAINGWDKTGYKNTTVAHYSKGLVCTACHVPHGSSNTRLQNAEDTTTAAGECTSCHQSGGSAPDVRTDLLKTYHHPTLTTSGKHNDTENYNSFPSSGGNRHAECADCHDPHSAGLRTSTTAPALPPSIQNVSGVDYNGTSVAWSDPALKFVNPVTYEYQLCFKCHSNYSWGTSPPTNPSGGTQTNIPKEFNPSNASYHAVVGASKASTTYGKYVSPWTATSRLYCDSCHGSDSATVKGPHGSANPWILTNPYNPSTVGTNSNDLCFKCHDKATYASSTGGGTTGYYNNMQGNLHQFHYSQVGATNWVCTRCHSPIPHGLNTPRLLAPKSGTYAVPAPYASQNLVVNTWGTSGNWRESNCSHGSQGSPCT